MQGRPDQYRPWVFAAAEEPVRRTKESAELRRCRLVHRGRGWGFTTTGPQGSGILRSMALADGLAVIPAGHPAGERGEEHLVILLAGGGADRPPYPSADDAPSLPA
jgi:molybdopterin biosynthesis enzyme